MNLYFLRHGLAGNRSDWQGDDAKRPLTTDGKEKIKRTAITLAALDLGLDVIVTSPFVRAKQTAEIVARKLNCPMVEDKRLAPGFSNAQLQKLLLDHPDAKAIMLVGHEPDFSDTISTLIGGGRIVCKKGALALVQMPSAHSKQGELVWLIQPKMLAQ